MSASTAPPTGKVAPGGAGVRKILDMDLASGVAAQLQHQLATLNATTYATNTMEIERLLNRFGEHAYQMLIGFLVRDIAETSLGVNFSSASFGRSTEGLKMKLLSQELLKLPKYPNFISIACGLVTAKELGGKGLQELVKGTSWLLPVQLALGLAFAHSNDAELREDGYAFLKVKLSECVLPNVVKTLPDFLVHHLLYCIQSTEVFSQQAKMLMQLETLRNSLLSLDSQSLTAKEAASAHKKRVATQSELPDRCIEELSLAGIMEELGPGCTATPEMLSSMTDNLPSLSAEAVGRAIGMMAMSVASKVAPSSTQLQCQQAFYDSMLAIGATQTTHEAEAAKTWNVPNFVKVIKERVGAADLFWKNALRGLDFRGMKLNSRGLNFLILVMKEATGATCLSIEPLLGEWENPREQLSVLTTCFGAPPDLVDFATPRQIEWGGAPAPKQWHSIDIVETLLNIQSHPQLREQVANVLNPKEKSNGPQQRHPELLLLTAISATPSRDEQRGALLRALVVQLLGTGAGRPSSVAVDIFARCTKEALEQTCLSVSEAFIEKPAIAEMVYMVAKAGNWLQALLANCCSARLLSQVVLRCTKEDAVQEVNITEWLTGVLEGGTPIYPNMATFTRTLLSTAELAGADVVVEGILTALAGDATQGLSPQQKQHAKNLITERSRPAQPAASPPAAAAAAPAAKDGGYSPSIEEEANKTFVMIFRQQIDIESLVKQLHACKGTPAGTPTHSLYLCMMDMIFEEFKHLEHYPEKELGVMAELVGAFISNGLLSSRLSTALKFIIPNLHKPQHKSLQAFAILTVQGFMRKLPEWPQCRTLLARVPHIERLVEGIAPYLATPAAQPAAPPVISQQQQQQQAQANWRAGQGAAPGSAPENDEKKKATLKAVFAKIDVSTVDSCANTFHYIQNDIASFFVELLIQKAALEPNSHKICATLVEKMRRPDISNLIIKAAVTAVRELLAAEDVATNTTLAGRLQNLGNWLGICTFARNRPLMSRELNMKALLTEGLPNYKIVVTLPFVVRVLQHTAQSTVFRPQNPWLMAMLGLLVEIHDLYEMDRAVKQQVEALVQSLSLKMSDLADKKNQRSVQRAVLADLWVHKKPAANPTIPDTPTEPLLETAASTTQHPPIKPPLATLPQELAKLDDLKEEVTALIGRVMEGMQQSMERNCQTACTATAHLVCLHNTSNTHHFTFFFLSSLNKTYEKPLSTSTTTL